MRYRDPFRSFEVELPLGWVCDRDRTPLLQVEFHTLVERGHGFGIQVIPALLDAASTDEAWLERLREQVSPPELRPTTVFPFAGRTVAPGPRTAAGSGWQQSLFVRGAHLGLVLYEAVAEGRAAREAGARTLTPIVSRALRTLAFPAEGRAPRLHEFDPVARRLHEARAALRAGDAPAAAAAAREVIAATIDVFLHEVGRGAAIFPPLPLMLADARLALWDAEKGDPGLLRDAELALERMRASLPLSKKEADAAAAIEADIARAQAVLVGREAEAPQASAFERRHACATWTLGRARSTADPDDQERLLEAAVVEFLEALATPRAVSASGSPMAEDLRARGFGDEQIARVLAAATDLAVLGELRTALLGLKDLGFRAGDAGRPLEIAALLVGVSDACLEVGGRGAPLVVTTAGALAAQVEDRVAHAYALFNLGDAPSFDAAKVVLREADGHLDRLEAEREPDRPLGTVPVATKAGLRAQWCLAAARIALRSGDRAAALALVERGAQAAADMAPDPERDLVRSELEDIRIVAEGGTPEGTPDDAGAGGEAPSSPYARLFRAHTLRNRALARLRAGDADGALATVRTGLRLALVDSPWNEYVSGLLHVAAGAFERRAAASPDAERAMEIAGWYLCLDAAADALDAARAVTPSPEARIGRGELEMARGLAEAMILQRGFQAQAPEHAIAASDRFRSRVLEQELRVRARSAPATAFERQPPPVLAEGPRDAVIAAAVHVSKQSRAALLALDGVLPLGFDEVAPLARETGAVLVLLHPIGERVAILAVGPGGTAVCRWSPAALSTWRDATDELLGWYRGEEAAASGPPDAERLLWDAAFEPLGDLLREGEHVVVVPYRELSLTPFWLLRDDLGRRALDRFVLSLCPSLATLRTMRARGARRAALPARAVIVGDPLPLAAEPGLGRLPAARAEAGELWKALLDAGVPGDALKLLRDEEATPEAFRAGAAHADLVHLACHARVSPEKPASASYLVLAGAGPARGLLRASEIPDVPLADALVYLGACETGRGRPTADGVIGLGRAFLEAGARAVVVSLWEVDDAVAAVIASHFYASLLDPAAGRGADEALREAIRRTRTDLERGSVQVDGKPLPATPGLWGPFVLVGDGQGVRLREARSSP